MGDDKCKTCKYSTPDGVFVCDGCIHEPNLRERYEPMTNADHIREMTDEELAGIIMCPHFITEGSCSEPASCIACCKDWLRQPYESATEEG